MEVKQTYAYKTIRRAAREKLLSFSTFRALAMLLPLVGSIYMLLHAQNYELWMILASLALLLFCCFFFFYTIKTYQTLFTEIAHPENGAYAMTFDRILPFEEMCFRLEAQKGDSLVPYFGENQVTRDFILLRSYGRFDIIPFLGVDSISPFHDRVNGASIYTVHISDFSGNTYIYRCDSEKEVMEKANQLMQLKADPRKRVQSLNRS